MVNYKKPKDIEEILGGCIMKRVTPLKVPMNEKVFLSIKDMSEHMGLGTDLIRDIVSRDDFKDFILIGKQRKVMIDRVAFENYVKEKHWV